MSSLDTSLENSMKEAERLALEAIDGAADIKALDAVKPEILGKKSPIRGLMKRLMENVDSQRIFREPFNCPLSPLKHYLL